MSRSEVSKIMKMKNGKLPKILKKGNKTLKVA